MPGCRNCGFESDQGFRFCPRCGTESSAGASIAEQRKIVTVLFCDLTGSTALGETLDPERLRALLARYFERMKAIVERHGGSVEKFIGDAVMAVFGVPTLHEDDALRAVRSAAEMRDALPDLGLDGRIGVTTGEVVTGTEERLATGDAVNVAARLEQAAGTGEVLIGEPTLELVRSAVDVEPIEPLELKGKTDAVHAYRLLRVRDASERPFGGPFVGRERELAFLRSAWERVRDGQGCELITVTGDAGVGKSRLVEEALAPIEETVLRGRCPPYGEGITYWPVVDVLRQLDVPPPDEAAEAVRFLLGESDAATSAEDIGWAFRKTLERAAAERPLVLVFDDIQWAEDVFLDLIEHIALLSSGTPILLCCIARPELAERRPAWPITFRLEPLDDDDVDELIRDRIGGDLRHRIARASGGNPLFVDEMLAMAHGKHDEVIVPPTLHALLAARVDQLETTERTVLQRAAIEGEVFHHGAVQALAPEETHVTSRLAALVRKELIRPDRPRLSGEEGFRFRHILIRDAAYEALPKSARAELHERFASWLEKRAAELVESDELLGYHLEQACRYLAELGTPDDGALAAAARRHLEAGGRRAALRQDYGAAVNLLERAAALAPPDEVDLALETELGEALLWTGRADDALHRADLLAERGAAAGDPAGEISGRIRGGLLRLNLSPSGSAEALTTSIHRALPELEAAGERLALYVAYSALAEVASMRSQMDAALDAWDRALAYASQAGHVPTFGVGNLAAYRYFGSTPASDLLAWLEENEPRAVRDQFLRAYRAMTLAMLGRLDEGRAILTEAREDQSERGGGVLLANLLSFESVNLELWAGDPSAAARYGREGFRLHEEMGNRDFLASAAAQLAKALYALGQLDEANGWAGRSAELGSSDDAEKEMTWRQVRAKVLARRGEHAEGERLAREAVTIGEGTDSLLGQGDAHADLAEVLVAAGRSAEATTPLRQALDRYERKEHLVLAQRMRERLAGSPT